MIRSAQRLAISALAALATTLVLAGPPPLAQPDLAARAFNGSRAVVGIGPTGYIYVAGTFTQVDGQPRDGIARLNPDGSLDAWAPTRAAPFIVTRAVESGGGAVALAHGGLYDSALLTYVAAGSSSEVLVDSAPASYRHFGALAFDASGNLFAAFTRDCNLGVQSGEAEVRKYLGGTAPDGGFSLKLGMYTTHTDYGDFTNGSCVSALATKGGDLYIGGLSTRSLRRVSQSNGTMDATWAPMGDRLVKAFALGQHHVYVAGYHEGVTTRNELARYGLDGAGARDAAWNPGWVSTDFGAIAVDEASGSLYVGGWVVANGIRGILAVSTGTGTVNDSWDPGVTFGNQRIVIRHIALRGNAVVFAGDFSAVAAQPRDGLAAVTNTAQPITGPAMSIEPQLLDFGTTFQANAKRSRSFTITSRGTSDLVIQGLLFYVPERYTYVHDCNGPIAPGNKCTVTVTASLEPFTQGWGLNGFSEALEVHTNGAGSLRQVSLVSALNQTYTFDGAAALSMPPGPVLVGTTQKTVLKLRNRVERPLAIEGMMLAPNSDPSSFPFTLSHACPAVLPGFASCDVTVTSHPTVPGVAVGILRLAGDASGDSPGLFTNVLAPEGDFDGDGVDNATEIALGRNPLAKDNDVFTDPQLFAMQQYRDFLGRAGDSGGVSYWANRIASGAVTRAEAIASFLGSNEFESFAAPVTRLYLAYFLRIPDYQGLDYWIGNARGGNSIASISAFFAGSDEFRSQYGVLDNAQFVERVYSNVLGRAPDSGGKSFWLEKLTAGSARGEVMLGFSESPEYRSLTSNESFVTMVYAGMLRQAPDAASYASWVSWLDAGNPRSLMIETVMASPEYRARFMQ